MTLKILGFAVAGVVAVGTLAGAAQDIRIDTFDTKSNRTGYIIIDRKTGRLDQFDARGNRLGSGTVTTPLGGQDRLFDSDRSRSGTGDRRAP